MYTQSNTKSGDKVFNAGEDLSGVNARLVKLTHSGGVPQLALPDDTDDVAFLLLEGDVSGAPVTGRPFTGEANHRVELKGTCNPGARLCLADHTTAADKGMLRTVPAAAGTYRVRAIAEEVGVDGQWVLVRPVAPFDVVVSG